MKRSLIHASTCTLSAFCFVFQNAQYHPSDRQFVSPVKSTFCFTMVCGLHCSVRHAPGDCCCNWSEMLCLNCLMLAKQKRSVLRQHRTTVVTSDLSHHRASTERHLSFITMQTAPESRSRRVNTDPLSRLSVLFWDTLDVFSVFFRTLFNVSDVVAVIAAGRRYRAS